jgi:hypothetical protein
MRSLSRRLVLRGFAGLGVTLPLLEFQMDKAYGQAAAPKIAKRFIVFFEHGGTISNVDREGNKSTDQSSDTCIVDGWRPLSNGTTDQSLAGKLGPIHQPLVGYESDLLVLSGVHNLAVQTQSPYAGDHGISNATALTNNMGVQNAAMTFWNAQGPSIDAVIAQRLQMSNPMPYASINLEVSAHNYGTPFFTGANQPTDSETDPRKAFASLFTNVTTGGQPDPHVLRAQALKKSVLDGTTSGLNLYRTKMSAKDQQTVDAHLTLIRGIEMQLSQMPVPLVGCTKPNIGTGPFATANDDTVYDAYIPNVGPAQVDILIAAFQCGLTNVGTLNIGDFYNDWMMDPYPAAYNIGHSLDHSANDTAPKGTDAAHFSDWYKTMLDNRVWRASMFKRLIAGLKNVPEGAGTMLDNSLVLWTSEFSYGGQHSSANLPIMLAGKAGGFLKTGQHIEYGTIDGPTGLFVTSATNNNLYTTCLQAFGYSDNSFGPHFDDHHSYYPNIVVTKSVDGPLPGILA